MNYTQKIQAQYKAATISKKYSVSIDMVLALLEKGCHFCGSYTNLCADHSHTTGKFRGILCSRHNIKLGQIEANKHSFRKYLAYLDNPPGAES